MKFIRAVILTPENSIQTFGPVWWDAVKLKTTKKNHPEEGIVGAKIKLVCLFKYVYTVIHESRALALTGKCLQSNTVQCLICRVLVQHRSVVLHYTVDLMVWRN